MIGMSTKPENTDHHHTPDEERKIREAALDETIEGSFPASDPLSSDPNPDDHDALERQVPADTENGERGAVASRQP